ncbi:MAG TPA: tetratricopeptide repeat protein [Ktedonobacteraceae bacterium]|nr:tetratricopeptide repeat protein [Ktedonobacteraceae bacterium]
MLEKLHETFQSEKRVVLAGGEGRGKTTLARAYTRRFGVEYQRVAWIDATTDETFLADVGEALQDCAVPVDMAQGSQGLFQILHRHLSEQQKALLVLDHVPFAFKLLDASEQLPLTYDCLVITHREQTPPALPRLMLNGLDEQAGALLLLRQAGLLAEQEELAAADDDTRLAALELAREMQGEPCALHLAAGYVREHGGSVRAYLELFRAYPVRLQFAGHEQEELAVAGEICLARVEQAYPGAGAILRTCALCLPGAIPAAWLPQADAEAAALQPLVALGLLETSQDGKLLNMHPRLQHLVRQFYGLDEQPRQRQEVELLLRRLRDLLPSLADETPSARLRLAGHIRHLEKLSQSWEDMEPAHAEVLSWAAEQLEAWRLSEQAATLLKRALQFRERSGEASPLAIAATLEKLAALKAQAGNYSEAQALARRVLTSKMEAQGIQHPDVLVALLQLGQYYAAQHKESEAEACYQKVISMGEVLKLRHHLVYSGAKYHLARLFIVQGKDEQAEDLLLRVCAVWKHLLGAQHPLTVEAQLTLAELAAHLKHWERALDLYQRAIPIYAEARGQAHPLVLKRLEQAAQVMFELGQLEEAKSAWSAVLALREQTREGASTASLNGLARVALAQGQLKEALAFLEQAQANAAGREEAADLVQAEMLTTLAVAHEAREDYQQAERAASKALEMRESLLGAAHLDLVEHLNTLARLKRALGENEEAEKLLRRALYCYQRAHRPEDMRLDPALIGLAEIESGRERFEVARMYLLRARAIRGLALSTDDARFQEIEQLLAENDRLRNLAAPSTSASKE